VHHACRSAAVAKHRQTGKTAESPKEDVFRLRGGKVVDFMEYYDTAKACHDLAAGPAFGYLRVLDPASVGVELALFT
jgi:hypothetical protein